MTDIENMTVAELREHDEAQTDAAYDALDEIADFKPVDGGNDPDDMNDNRGYWGSKACELMSDMTGCDTMTEAPGDAIANILHFVTQQTDMTAEGVIRNAVMHFNAETGEGEL